MKRLIVFLLLSGMIIPAYSQTVESKISFRTTEHDFGRINEQDGKVTYEFELINTGGKDLLVQNVQASCGCTASSWTKTPIPPGGKGFVAATYNPAGRPGSFRKYLTVVTNSNPANIRLAISGEVIPKPRSVEDDYRYEMGQLRLKSNHIPFSALKDTQKDVKKMEVINNSDETIELTLGRVPSHISVKAEPSMLKPEQKGVIVAEYDATQKKEYGFIIDRFQVYINGETDRNYSMVVSANIEEDFSSLTAEQLANAPRLEIDNTEFKFGQLKQGEKVDHTFVMKNNGNSDLIIRQVKSSCGCTAVQPAKKVIAPGEEIDIKAIFNSAGKIGNQNKTITIITNDPNNSKMILWVKGEVVKS